MSAVLKSSVITKKSQRVHSQEAAGLIAPSLWETDVDFTTGDATEVNARWRGPRGKGSYIVRRFTTGNPSDEPPLI